MELFQNTHLSPSVLAEIRRLQFYTRKLADQGIVGQYKSAFKGRGIEFEEVREYIPGDDIRTIDWKVTARSGCPYIKRYREERELTVVIAVDVSGSTLSATRAQLKDRLLARIGAMLTFIALQNNDRVGLLTFTDKVQSYHPPRKARNAVWRILHDVMAPRTPYAKTDIAGMCSFIRSVLRRPSIVFLLSDFIDSNFEHELGLLTRKHDVTAVMVRDPIDSQLPPVGLLDIRNPETGELTRIDCSDSKTVAEYKSSAEKLHEERVRLFSRYGIGLLDVSTDEPFIRELRAYLIKRHRMRQ